MAALIPLLRHATSSEAYVTDCELLARFAGDRDQEGFDEVVRRHGPVVYRTCCRLVGLAGHFVIRRQTGGSKRAVSGKMKERR